MSIEVPVIDVNRFQGKAWLEQMDVACRNWGCFQIINHGMDTGLMGGSVAQMRRFFALSGEEKRAIERTAENAWGYFDRELTKNVRDWKEIFDFGLHKSVLGL